ncbi:NnrS family protein [Hyphomicrobium denitrificans ATCC 51888]|uniref:NnrS family protein n=1 Tax=Hyphomicrobium denitrificans (strain ATCC 51888 / DSM 1869 / NCIMB 11706 / TK 0415) TaxID=582899 RepID=D8JR87_HYPDA|nr:NnrS family protein [Hyphomicrobium denitrificans]ADJ24072.1 NnrS family protein [Hyphomicrobium denitrificans ATCC 51888]
MAAVAGKKGMTVWTIAFRPLFLAASLWSVLALAVWVLVLTQGLALPSRFAPIDWHVHEMLFGFIPAAIAGFLLTAIPNWTGRAPVRGLPLIGLVTLWVAGRIACFSSALLPVWMGVAVDSVFLLALGLVVTREIVLAGNYRNLIMPVPIAVLLIANILTHLEALGVQVPSGVGRRLGITAVVFLMSVIAGRIIPAFTRNWLMMRKAEKLPSAAGRFDAVAVATLALGLLGWVFFPASIASGAILLAAAALNGVRLLRWRGFATTAEPLLAILHVGYFWIVVGAALLGASILGDHVPEPAAIHALTAGAMGTMVLAVMSRVSLGHTGRMLHADAITTTAYAAITLATLTRIAAACLPSLYAPLISLSGVLWIASFGIFVAYYGPMLLAPRTDRLR